MKILKHCRQDHVPKTNIIAHNNILHDHSNIEQENYYVYHLCFYLIYQEKYQCFSAPEAKRLLTSLLYP